MHVPGAALPRSRPGWLGPAAVGIALVAIAFIAASYLAPSQKSDPMAGTIAKLEDQVRADPQSADLRIEVADAYMSANRPKEALAQYQEALRIDGSREEAIYGGALAYRQLGDLNNAGAQLQSIVQLNESNPMAALDKRLQGAHFYLGLILREQGRNDEAINEFRAALSLNRSDADTLFELGKTFALAGQNDDAASAFDITLAFVPEFEEAYVETEKLATATGDTTKVAFARAMLDVLHGKAKDATPALRGIAEGANSARYWWGLGYALEKTNDNAGAVAAYQKAVEINPGELLAAESLRRLQETGSP
jgi:tetratricopeptide (TPR) repeat protein